jgi:hypothetical protein
MATAPVVMGSAAPVAVMDSPALIETRVEEDEKLGLVVAEDQASPIDEVKNAVLNALSNGGHRMLSSMLESGEWQLAGSELVIKVASSATVIDMSLGAEGKRLAIATASGVLGRAMRLKVLPGGVAQSGPTNRISTSNSNGSGRSRAEQDPVVQHMKEKFGAEIRTIIDYREKDYRDKRS